MARTGSWHKAFALAVGIGFCLGAEAGFLSKLAFWSSKDRVDALVITGNYAKSRLLAELVQQKTKQPIMLISPTDQGDTELFFLPSAPEAMALPAEKYVEFVDFLKPKRLVFLGDDAYVPPAYLEMLRDSYPTVVVTSNDWQKNAEALAEMFECRKLAKDYAAYLAQLEEASLGRPEGLDDEAPAGAPKEPSPAPRSVTPAP